MYIKSGEYIGKHFQIELSDDTVIIKSVLLWTKVIKEVIEYVNIKLDEDKARWKVESSCWS